MYAKDLVKRVTLRLDQQLADYITDRSERLQVTPSQLVRMILHAYVDSVESPNLTAATNLPIILSSISTEKAVTSENDAIN